MSGITVETRSLRAVRLRALAPRLLAYAALALLCLAGLRAILARPPAAPIARAGAPGFDLTAAAFAESFARAYLSFDPAAPELRERRLRRYLSDGLEADGGRAPAAPGPEGVAWTSVLAERRAGRRVIATVAAEVGGELLYLAVPVERDPREYLSVPAYPALVGPPATDTSREPSEEDDVEDPRLRTIAERAVRNYLAGQRQNLLADLAPEAVVSLPDERLAVRSVESVTWAEPRRRVAVQVQARDRAGGGWTLRYELSVMRRDRWYVRSLETDPTANGGGLR